MTALGNRPAWLERLRKDVTVTIEGTDVSLADSATRRTFEFQLPGDDSLELFLDMLSGLALADEDLSLEEIRTRQLQRCRELRAQHRIDDVKQALDFAVRHVPYYRERRALYEPTRIQSVADLSSVPILTKSDLRAHFPDRLLADNVDIQAGLASGSLEIAATSGTTGERLQVVVDMEADSVPAAFEDLWGFPESDSIPKTAVFTSPTCMGNECHKGEAPYERRFRGEHTLFLNSTEDLFSLKRRLAENIVEEMHRFAPDMLLVNPVYLHWLVRRTQEWGLALPKVRMILSCYQYLTHTQRAALEAAFDAPVCSYYFATDLSGCRIGIQCPKGNLHVREDQVYAEVIGRSGPTAPDELGTLAVSAHANRVMPLFRYVVGDVARLQTQGCDCVLGDWPCLELHGRMKDMVRVGERWVTTREVDDAIGVVNGVDFYKVIQNGPTDFLVEVVPSIGATADTEEVVRRLSHIAPDATVHVRLQHRLEPEVSMKFRPTQCAFLAPPEVFE